MDFAHVLDIGKRIIQHPNNYYKWLYLHELTFVSYVQESENVFSFFFAPTYPIQWKAGQHGIFQLSSAYLDRTRVFSIASAPSEKHIQISTVITSEPSQFKTALLELKSGQTVKMRGPIGEFHARKNQHIIGIAGGIGITPFRSLIKDLVDTSRNDIAIDLLYGCSSDRRTFDADLNNWSQLSNVSVHYLENADSVANALQMFGESHYNKADYYLSGSPKMISAITKQLTQLRINNIINDPFKGY